MTRPSPAHIRRTVPLSDLEAGDVLIFPHAWTGAAHSWEVWRLPTPTASTPEAHPESKEIRP